MGLPLAEVLGVAFDFDGVFTDNAVYVDEQGVETVRCSRADGLGIEKLRALGLKLVVLSSEPNPVVRARCAKLGLECRNGLRDKASELQAWALESSVPIAKIAYLGNDENDEGCFRIAGLSVSPSDAWPTVFPLASMVLRRPGGHGAVRELCEAIFEAQRGRL